MSSGAGVRTKVDVHGKRQLEVGVVYPVEVDRAKSRYVFDLYLFSPYQLAMTQGRYGVQAFMEDIHSYTRYTTPVLSLAQLADVSCQLSPVCRMLQRAAESSAGKPGAGGDAVQYELRMLVGIFREQVKSQRKTLRSAWAGDPAAARAQWAAAIEGPAGVIGVFRDRVLPAIRGANFPDALVRSAVWADEALSLFAEKQWLRMVQDAQGQTGTADFLAALGPYLASEENYRRKQGYKTVLEPGDPESSRRFVYHEGMLKKWAESCMFMSTARNSLPDRVTQVLMGVAAAVAMLFAVVATIQVSKWFPQDSVPWAILIVVMYVFKDRIKEWLRAVFAAYIPQLLADRTDDLIDWVGGGVEKHRVGSSKLRVRFMGPGGVPDEILQARKHATNEFRSILPEENVIEFHKELKLDSALLRSKHKRLDSITEILRLDLDRFFTKMDDPETVIPYWREGLCGEVVAQKIYHLHIILRFGAASGADPKVEHYVVRANRDGIIEIADRT